MAERNGNVGGLSGLGWLQVGIVTMVFSAGVFVGRGGIGEVLIRLTSHEGIEVHTGAVRRPVYEAESRQFRTELNTISRRLERLEENYRRQALFFLDHEVCATNPYLLADNH